MAFEEPKKRHNPYGAVVLGHFKENINIWDQNTAVIFSHIPACRRSFRPDLTSCLYFCRSPVQQKLKHTNKTHKLSPTPHFFFNDGTKSIPWKLPYRGWQSDILGLFPGISVFDPTPVKYGIIKDRSLRWKKNNIVVKCPFSSSPSFSPPIYGNIPCFFMTRLLLKKSWFKNKVWPTENAQVLWNGLNE